MAAQCSASSAAASARTEPLRIYTDADWEKMYPERSKTEFPVHFRIARGEAAAITEYAANSHKRSYLVKADPSQKRVTPLIMLIMRGDEVAVRAFLDLAKTYQALRNSLNKSDSYGWTPLHHAAISSKAIYDMLTGTGAKQLENHLCGTPADLRVLAGNAEPMLQQQVFFEDTNGELRPFSTLSPGELQELFGMEKMQLEPRVTQGALQAFWAEDPSIQVKTFVEAFQQGNLPKLVVKRNKELGSGTLCYDLHATHPIKKDTLITVYGGEIIAKPQAPGTFSEACRTEGKSPFWFPPFDAQRVRGPGAFINHRWPNAVMCETTFGGVKHQCVVAGRDIKEGEPIGWSYGLGKKELAYGGVKLFGKEEMCRFFRKHPFETLIPNLNKIHEHFSHPSEKVSQARKAENFGLLLNYSLVSKKLLFPVETPSAMLHLHLEGIVRVEKWLELLMNGSSQIIIASMQVDIEAHHEIRSFIQRVIEFDAALNGNAVLARLAKNWIQKRLEVFTVMQTLKAMQLIAQLMSESPTVPQLFATLKKIEKELPDYNWVEDPDAPLGSERRYQDRFKVVREKIDNGSLPLVGAIASLQMNILQMMQLGFGKEHESVVNATRMMKELMGGGASSSS